VEDARLAQAVARIEEMLQLRQRAAYATAVRDYLTEAGDSASSQPPQYLARLSVRSVGQIESIAVDDVRWFGASGNYVELHLGKRVVLHRVSIGALERRLDPGMRVASTRSVACWASSRAHPHREGPGAPSSAGVRRPGAAAELRHSVTPRRRMIGYPAGSSHRSCPRAYPPTRPRALHVVTAACSCYRSWRAKPRIAGATGADPCGHR
jgi:hypothetical protein